MKKFFVLTVLFALPIVAYLFFASGKNNFARLPILTEDVSEISGLTTYKDEPVFLEDHISVVAFFGEKIEDLKGNTFNLDKKILEKYYAFDDFQFVIILPENAKASAADFIKEFEGITNAQEWKFVFGSPDQIQKVFNSFSSPYQLSEDSYSPYVFIVDKSRNLRGRDDDDEGSLYGYDSRDIAELTNKMNDDVKVILAEYRLALKKNNAERKNN
ncbi:hypothetical protein [Zunongwangia profunda]|jgi:hypothetical protein|uniref:Membrane or secreted protein n=1 Tax=Zunongwangia profunda TaxID=398743 RepID=A0A3D5J4C9_9FLAO|nr:hypothetical protein [Zunongwangia profunda]MAC63618.1 hypothetical protein [Flavobacteriaceae bacterium]MAS72516.1 hypothetical protein [Zunongwangia sp.]HAJ82148.1 hypothetical protein [Zunongwangia profunda]HCV82951.1 hypothetical protein [Zunongwangia profunda]|tara:strand:- start:5934 stop:6578 length:645 start_codon:yes stop_codon:yes gene_type:complete